MDKASLTHDKNNLKFLKILDLQKQKQQFSPLGIN